jgi:hypothetical protein
MNNRSSYLSIETCQKNPILTEIFFSFIARYILQQGNEMLLCVTGIAGFVITGCAALASGIVVEHI